MAGMATGNASVPKGKGILLLHLSGDFLGFDDLEAVQVIQALGKNFSLMSLPHLSACSLHTHIYLSKLLSAVLIIANVPNERTRPTMFS